MNLHRAKTYLEEAMLAEYGSINHFNKGLTEMDIFLSGFSGHYSHDDLLSAVIGVGHRYDGKLEIALHDETVCHSNGCKTLQSRIAGKFFLGEYQFHIYRRSKTSIQLRSGEAIGHSNIVANRSYGTLGGLIISQTEGKNVLIFSNNHVLANSNNARIGDLIYQAGNYPTVIGKLENYVPIVFKGINELDLAIARVDFNVPLQASRYIKPRTAHLGERVVKTGATTGTRTGRVVSIDYTDKVNYGGHNVVFVGQTKVVGENGIPFSAGGDSGSLIFSLEDDAFVGLLFAGGTGMTLANSAAKVAEQLKKWKL